MNDREWARAVKERDHYTCCRCGKIPAPGWTHAHHIFGRKKSVRHDLDNGVTLCGDCHGWAHGNPRLFDVFVGQLLGAEMYDELERRSRTFARWSPEVMEREEDHAEERHQDQR